MFYISKLIISTKHNSSRNSFTKVSISNRTIKSRFNILTFPNSRTTIGNKVIIIFHHTFNYISSNTFTSVSRNFFSMRMSSLIPLNKVFCKFTTFYCFSKITSIQPVITTSKFSKCFSNIRIRKS